MPATTHLVITLSVSFCLSFHFGNCSVGDRSYVFSKCVWKCNRENCSDVEGFDLMQPLHMKVLKWSCDDECKYDCMWQTVKAFEDDGSGVPQFYGKWPFVRYAGVQEPASMIFSVLNALTHLTIIHFRAKVPSTMPMYRVWHGVALVGIVTWTSAAVFHTRDFPLTEKMDYFSASGLVFYNLFTLIARLNVARDSRLLLIPGILLSSLYVYHISCLCDHFDYGYNMAVNVAVGALNSLGWVCWSWYQYTFHGKRHVLLGAAVVLALSVLLTLELFDFPPLLWALDAHAVWHAGTIPLTFMWYKFIIEDSLQLEGSKDAAFKKTV